MNFDFVLTELICSGFWVDCYKILRQIFFQWIFQDSEANYSLLDYHRLQTAYWWFLILIHLRNSQMKSIYANFSKCFVADSAWIFFIQKGTVILWDKGPLFTYEVNHDIIYNLIILRWLYKAKICKTAPTTECCT